MCVMNKRKPYYAREQYKKETLQNTTMRNVATNRCCAGGLHQITSSSNYRCHTKVKGILRHKGITVAFLGA